MLSTYIISVNIGITTYYKPAKWRQEAEISMIFLMKIYEHKTLDPRSMTTYDV